MTPQDVVSAVLKSVAEKAKVGANLLDLERSAETTMTLYGVISANKGYQPNGATVPFPSVLCLGVNDTIAHGIPKDYDLKDGDLLTIDCGVMVDGKCGDAGFTIPIGTISNADERLLRYTRRALYEGIKAVKPGIKVTEIGKAIERLVLMNGYVVNRYLHGHGIGEQMHMEPTIPNFEIGTEQIKEEYKNVNGKVKYRYKQKERTNIPTLYEGQIICIEPHVTYRDFAGIRGSDGWTIKTHDGKKSAMAEHMVKVTSLGYEILTSHIKEEVK